MLKSYSEKQKTLGDLITAPDELLSLKMTRHIPSMKGSFEEVSKKLNVPTLRDNVRCIINGGN